MHSKTDDRAQDFVGRPTAAHDISGRPLTKRELTALLLMERRNTILRAQVIALEVEGEHSGIGIARGARLVYDKLSALYAETSAEMGRATALAEVGK